MPLHGTNFRMGDLATSTAPHSAIKTCGEALAASYVLFLLPVVSTPLKSDSRRLRVARVLVRSLISPR